MARRSAQRGQVAVETALTMPLYVFIFLGLIQLGLMHQARLMAKYAAYKAVRAGSLNRADMSVMRRAALAVLLPMVTRDGANTGVYNVAGTSDGDAATYDNTYSEAYQEAVKGSRDGKEGGAVDIAEITVCNPTAALGVFKPTTATDFDDPRRTGEVTINGPGWNKFTTSRLSIQLTFHFRMVIPFANSVLWRMVAGTLDAGTAQVLRMKNGASGGTIDPRLTTLASTNKFVLPIRASYAMRMYSNYSDAFLAALPADNNCRIPWGHYTPPPPP